MKIELTPFKVIIAGLFIMIILVPLWFYLILTASPDPKVDYLALYNASNKPENFDESKNAWPIYEQAIAAAVEVPVEVLDSGFYLVKTSSSEKLAEIEKALAANKHSLDLMRQAVELPYCYVERVSEDGSIWNVLMPELSGMKHLAQTMTLECQYNIYNEDFDQAISDIVCINKLARHKQKKSAFLIEQILGESVKQMWITQGYSLAKQMAMVDSQSKRLRVNVDSALSDMAIIDYEESERIFFYDIAQRIFVGSKNGHGRRAWKVRRKSYNWSSFDDWKDAWGHFKICAFGVTQKEVEQKYDKAVELLSKVRLMTPWQYGQDKTGIENDLKSIDSWFLQQQQPLNLIFPYTGNRHYILSYRIKANLLGLQTVLAIKEFQLANNRLPQSLAELVEKQYLKEVPLDPFSEGELMYKVDGDSYQLYSWGDDLKDNSGSRVDDFVFWPLPDVDKMMVSGSQTVEAINKFQQEQNSLPRSLAELVDKQYLKEVPLDPFSDGELVYEVEDESYQLYSCGYNLYDNSGNRDSDFIFWPLSGKVPDDVFWKMPESQADDAGESDSQPESEPDAGLGM